MKHTRYRSVTMGAAAMMALLASAPATGFAQNTLNFGTPGGFGNLSCLDSGNPVNLLSYGGFSFAGLRIAQPSQFTGKCAASNSGLTTSASVTAIGGSSFAFQSARFADAFPSGGTAVTLSGFLGGKQVFSNMLTLGSSVGAGTLFTNTSTGNIDRLDILQTGNDPFLLDDFTTNGSVSATVAPEPASWAMLALGLGVMIPLARRKRKA